MNPRRVSLAVAAAGISSFTLLYAPQAVLPELAAQFHLDPGGASLAVSVATGALAITVLPIAVLSEVLGRRPVILASVIGSVLLGLLLPLAPSYPVLLVLRALQGIAIAGFPGVAAAYLVEQLGISSRGGRMQPGRGGVAAAVGAMIAGNTIGGMAGRLVTGFTAGPFGWHGALAVAALVALLCGVVTVATLPGAPPPRTPPSGAHPSGAPQCGVRCVQRTQSGVRCVQCIQRDLTPRDLTEQPRRASRLRGVAAGLGQAVRKPVLLAQYAIAMLAMGAFVALYNAAGFRLTGAPIGLSPAIASLVFLAYAAGTVSSATAGRLSTRFGRVRTLVAALVVTIGGAAMTLSDLLALVVLGFLVLTGGFFTAHATANGWAAAEPPENARGQVGGLYTLSYYLGSSVGGTLGAVVYGHFGWPALIVFAAGLLAAAVGVVLTVRAFDTPRRRPVAASRRRVAVS